MTESSRGWPRKRTLLLLYGLLLSASFAVRKARERPFELPPTESMALVPEMRAEAERAHPPESARAEEARVRLVWRDSGRSRAGTLPSLLLHGSPGSASDFERLVSAWDGKRRLLRPSLPGFGHSEPDVADYSSRAHARYALALLDELELERVHVVGFSMGGAVASELLELAPERVASLTLLAATGVQELELFGDYHMNRAVHGLQLAGLFALYELVPHFGAFDGSMLSLAYARNFYDTDQRPLRAYLSSWEGPTLILHGTDDVLVPLAAAEEHHRIVPQSRLEVLPGNHFLVFRQPDQVVDVLERFFAEVEGGRAPLRGQLDEGRLAAAARAFDFAEVPPLSGFSLALLLVLAALATLVSEDLTCVAVGALIGQGRVGFFPGVAACFLGIYIGDLALFLAGRFLGRGALGRAPLSWFLSEERVAASSEWFERRGPAVIFLSRFLPGLRLPTYFASGVLRTSFWRFSMWFALAAALWTPILVWLSSLLGGELSERVDFLRSNLLWALAATVAVGVFVVKFVRPLATYRGRRLLVSAWRRATRWEYWPPWVVYSPIALYCLWLGVRHRKLLAFTAANPAIPHGGFVGESKYDILSGLSRGARSDASGFDPLPRTLLLAADESSPERGARLERFRTEHGLDLPLVLKPDVGERGKGVLVVRDEARLASELATRAVATLVQEYVAGEEFGLFYVREPDAQRGRLISIVAKHLPAVEGDGRRTLEQLILEDPRTNPMAREFLSRPAAELARVPGAGESVALGELGTHCRGATFLDGGELASDALVRAVDDLARGFEGFYFGRFEGFYFGRFDVRAESKEALRSGRFRVLELNGVTSEAAHVYDPRYSILDGWRVLAGQWRLAYRIGAANAARGAPVSSAGDLWRAYRRARARDATRASKTPGRGADALFSTTPDDEGRLHHA